MAHSSRSNFDLFSIYLLVGRYLLICAVMEALFPNVSGIHVSESEMPLSIYYDPETRKPLRITSIKNSLVGLTTSWSSTKTSGLLVRQVAVRANGCRCQERTCGCCLGINLQQLNFNREGCMHFTYDPDEFSIRLDMFLNDQKVYTNTISARNPPPLCVPLMTPVPLPASVEFCAKLFDIRTPGQNLHMCFDFETRLQKAAVLILHFDCMQMGDGGVVLLKPGQEAGTQQTSTESQVDVDVYDEVTEIKYKNSSDVL